MLIQLLSIQIHRSDRGRPPVTSTAATPCNGSSPWCACSPLSSFPYHEILKASRSETLLLRLADEPLQPDNRSPASRSWCGPSSAIHPPLAVEISAELKQDIQRSRAWQHHNRMMKDRNGMPPPQDMRLYGSIELPNGGWLQFSSWWTRRRRAGPGRPPSTCCWWRAW